MVKHRLRVAFVLASVPLLACDGSKSVGSSATATDFCSSFQRSLSELANRCFGGTATFWNDLYAQVLDCGRVNQRVSSGELSYDRNLGAECLRQVSEHDCSDMDELSICTSALAGHVPVGGSCADDTLTVFTGCETGAYCRVSSNTCGGTCAAYLQPGETCVYSSQLGEVSFTLASNCTQGSSCQLRAGVCVPEVAEGQPCGGSSAGDCADGLYCVGADGLTAGTCQRRKTSGACEDGGECASLCACIGEEGAKTCRRMKAPGEPCTPGLRECFSLLTWCGSDGKCTDARAQEGQTCGRPNGEYIQCATGLRCVYEGNSSAGTCQKQLPAGSPCTSGDECAGTRAYCDETTKLCVACE